MNYWNDFLDITVIETSSNCLLNYVNDIGWKSLFKELLNVSLIN